MITKQLQNRIDKLPEESRIVAELVISIFSGEIECLQERIKQLENYFYADGIKQNVEVWNYTAGWFEKETNLDNFTLLLPLKNDNSDYSVINHCR